MSDTIELLEAIGQNASLRFAPSEELVRTLQDAGASEALRTAAVTGMRSTLIEELGPRPSQPPQIVNSPGHEEDEPDEDKDKEDDEEPPMQLNLQGRHSHQNQK